MPVLAAGKNAPPFELTATDGKPYSLKEALARGPVLAAFFKASCPTCQYTLPFIERIYQQLRDKGVQIWGVSQDNAKDTQRLAKDYGLNFPILVDENDYAVSNAYGLEFVPSYFLITPDGQVEISGDGFSKQDLLALQRSLAENLGTKPPALFRPDEKIPEYKPG